MLEKVQAWELSHSKLKGQYQPLTQKGAFQAQAMENAGQNMPLDGTVWFTRYTSIFHQAELIQVCILTGCVE